MHALTTSPIVYKYAILFFKSSAHNCFITSKCKHNDLIPCVFAAEGVSGQGARPQVPGHHEEPGAEIRHPGAEEGGERGRHRGWRQRDQERHLRISVRDDRDYESIQDEHSECFRSIRYHIVQQSHTTNFSLKGVGLIRQTITTTSSSVFAAEKIISSL